MWLPKCTCGAKPLIIFPCAGDTLCSALAGAAPFLLPLLHNKGRSYGQEKELVHLCAPQDGGNQVSAPVYFYAPYLMASPCTERQESRVLQSDREIGFGSPT